MQNLTLKWQIVIVIQQLIMVGTTETRYSKFNNLLKYKHIRKDALNCEVFINNNLIFYLKFILISLNFIQADIYYKSKVGFLWILISVGINIIIS